MVLLLVHGLPMQAGQAARWPLAPKARTAGGEVVRTFSVVGGALPDPGNNQREFQGLFSDAFRSLGSAVHSDGSITPAPETGKSENPKILPVCPKQDAQRQGKRDIPGGDPMGSTLDIDCAGFAGQRPRSPRLV